MEIRLGKKGDYVVRAAIALGRAFDDGGYRKIREVAEEMDIPRTYAPQILNLLLKARLADARAGRAAAIGCGGRLVKSRCEW